MSYHSKKKSPLELAELIIQHNPSASMEEIGHVISEWGSLFDDQRMGAQGGERLDRIAPNRQLSAWQSYLPHMPTKRQLDRAH